MKKENLTFTIVFLFLAVLLTVNFVFAEETESTNYRIEGARIAGGGGEANTNDGGDEYSILGTIGELSDERTNSGTYSIKPGTPNVYVANVPLVECFETVSNGSTTCSDADLNPDGTIMLCGDGGCYDRARVEIDTQNNTTDTLYSIQIKLSTDTTWSYVDGTTFLIEDASTHDINDYLSETAWEGTVNTFNILGMKPGASYDVRITALQGDFTESPPSPVATATTAYPQINFDLDIAPTTGTTAETSAPHEIALGLLSPVNVTTANNLIWFDLGSNSEGGSQIFIEDLNTGLNSATTGYTIASDNEDLAAGDEGFGILEFSATQTYLGPLAVTANYGNGGDVVGQVSTTLNNIYGTTANPIFEGRGSLYVKGRGGLDIPAGADYQDTLTFTVVGTF